MHRTFTTPDPVDLDVEIQAGDVTITATETTETVVSIGGSGADQVLVGQNGRTVSVIGPKLEGLLRRTPSLDVSVTVPTSSDLTLKVGSADVAARGTFGAVQARSGSGDISLDQLTAPSRAVTGSGDLSINRAAAPLEATSGSGDVGVGECAEGLRVKVGSGEIALGTAVGDIAATTGSGDIRIRSLGEGEARLRTGSGDVRVGVPDGVPVWTDISAQGGVTSTLTSRGAPADGEAFVAVRAQVGSGSIHLEQV
jgi:DUF4097 and DUF4098 domain-containing protein YvlB